MDPYKILGVSQANIKHDSDLDPVRKRTKTLFKRFSAEKNKFDAKKVLEAFEMIKRNLKGNLGEGQFKLIGRSRKERDLDKHFNHQTKDIKKDKSLKRIIQDKQQGERRIRLKGDKERVARPSRRAHKRHQKKKQKLKKHVDSLQALQKLSRFLESEKKFPKAIPLLNRWVRGYMNVDNRGDVFEVLDKLAKADYATENADSRQELIQTFEYVMGYFSAWFDEDENNKMLRLSWRVASVLACHCHTDDAFMLSRTITSLNEALAVLEENRDKLDEEEPKAHVANLPMAYGLPTPPGSPLLSDAEPPSGSPPLGSPSLDDAGVGEGEMMEYYPDFSSSEDEGAVKEEPKVEVKDELKVEVKDELKEVKEETNDMKKARPKKPVVEIALDSDDDGVQDLDEDMVVDSEDSVHDIDSAAEDSDGVYESLSSGCCESSDVEEMDMSFKSPPASSSLKIMSEYFVMRCLGTLFMARGPQWARPKIDAFFQEIYFRRSIFSAAQQERVEAWQARIKVLQKGGERGVGEANNPMEAHRPVIDSRETVSSMTVSGDAWAAKQTFDSRDRCGGSGVIR